MKHLAIILLIILCFTSCSKEDYPRVEYRVNSSGSATIAYTMVTPSIRTEDISGNWKVSFKHSKGASVFLSAINTGFGKTTISVYLNKELLHSKSTEIPGALIEISEEIP
jgi:hypothetical protein